MLLSGFRDSVLCELLLSVVQELVGTGREHNGRSKTNSIEKNGQTCWTGLPGCRLNDTQRGNGDIAQAHLSDIFSDCSGNCGRWGRLVSIKVI